MEVVNIQAYSYTVLSSIIGMLIVFAFLGFLSLMMVVIKRIFEKQPDTGKTSLPKSSPEGGKPAESGVKDTVTDNSWVIAAVAAYLDEEDQPKSALSWQPAESEKHDPWVNVPRIQKRLARI